MTETRLKTLKYTREANEDVQNEKKEKKCEFSSIKIKCKIYFCVDTTWTQQSRQYQVENMKHLFSLSSFDINITFFSHEEEKSRGKGCENKEKTFPYE